MHLNMALILLLFSALCTLLHTTAGQWNPVGVCYGTMGNNQPSAEEAVTLMKSTGIQRVRLYGPDYNALNSLRNTSIQVMLGVPNQELQNISISQDNANLWIQKNVQNYHDVFFRYIVVGNGISPTNDQTCQYQQFVLPAMQKIKNALSAADGNFQYIIVTTAIDYSETLNRNPPKNHYDVPPSQGEFRQEVRPFLDPIISFLVNNNNAQLLINIHPYFSYENADTNIPSIMMLHGRGPENARLEYATFTFGQANMVEDGYFGYKNVFDAMVDTVHSALEKAGASSLDVVVSEVGWPTAGGPDATNDVAATFNNNLINHVLYNGTPKRPIKRIETYIFSLFDENQRGGQEVERHWGIFWNNKQTKYQINFEGQKQQ